MQDLRRILWDGSPADPVDQLENSCWLFLVAAWFAQFEHSLVRPRLATGAWVVCDSWYFKYAARYRVKAIFDQTLVDAAFSALRRPDAVVWLDVPPEVAADRKETFTACECGTLEPGMPDRSRAAFIAFQERVRGALRTLSDPATWIVVPADREPPQALVARVARRLRRRLGASPASALSAPPPP